MERQKHLTSFACHLLFHCAYLCNSSSRRFLQRCMTLPRILTSLSVPAATRQLHIDGLCSLKRRAYAMPERELVADVMSCAYVPQLVQQCCPLSAA